MKYNAQVASVDTDTYIKGIGDMIETYVSKGYEPYMMTLIFNISRCRITPQEIENAVYKVYGRFLTEVVRNPWSENNSDKRPILIGCPDWPVFKREGSQIDAASLSNDGVHFGSMLLVPPFVRLKTGVPDHFEVKRKAYVRPGGMLSRIHLKHVHRTPGAVTAYVLKSLTKTRCGSDDLIVLPRSRSER